MKILITTEHHPKSYLLAYLISDNEIFFGGDIENFPKQDSMSLAHELLKICLDLEIDVVFPLRSKELGPLAASSVLFEEYSIKLMVDRDVNPILDFKYIQTDDFSAFSKGLLNAGYPNKSLAIGKADCSGNLIMIDDRQKDFNQVWDQMVGVSFSQAGKLFNHSPFIPISIYQLEGDLKNFHVLMFKKEFYFSAGIDTAYKNLIKNKLEQENVEGFYQIDVSGSSILRIKSAIF